MKTKIQHFMIDPPWNVKRVPTPHDKKLRKFPYATLDVKQIFKLLDIEVFSLGQKNHNVFLWTLDKFLLDSHIEMTNRKYKLCCRFIWDKGPNGVLAGMPIRRNHEYLVWYYKEKLPQVDNSTWGLFTTVIRENKKSSQHSRKPDSAYSLIERLYPNQSYMDVFSRQSREGWKQFGNEKDYFPSFERVFKI